MQHTTRTLSYRTTTRTELDGATLSVHTHTVTLLLDGEVITAFVDGIEATHDRAHLLITLAQRDHTLEVLDDSGRRERLSRPQACNLHKDLSRLGYTHAAHYEIAAAYVGRELASLTELAADEVDGMWAHACLVRGYSTPLSRRGQVAA